jgi:SAM-dependent methyltransferase
VTAFDPALAGHSCVRVDSDGTRHTLPVRRWRGRCQPVDRHLLRQLRSRTLDVGCGPGRLTSALTSRGVPALGVDTSATAVRLTRRRGGNALRRSVFDRLPHEGRWGHVLLADGNIGIGGDPAALLRRCAELLAPAGTVLIECDPPGSGLWRGESFLHYPGHVTTPFRWARAGVDTVRALVDGVPLRPSGCFHRDGRWFIQLERR